MAVSSVVRAQLGRASWIRRMFEEGARLRAQLGKDAVIDLSLGNPEVEPPPAFHQTLERVVQHELGPGAHRYMHNAGLPETREAVAAALAAEFGLPFTRDDIVMCCGAAAGLNLVLKAVLEPGDEVVVLAPYFPEYPFYVENHGGRLREVPTRADFSLDPDALARALGPRTAALIVNSPNNPTGRLLSAAELDAIAGLLRERAPRALLVSDEPYRRLVFSGQRFASVLGRHARAVVVGSHSKDLAVPGERIGYVALSPEMPPAERAELAAALAFLTRTLGYVNAPALMQRVVRHLQGLSVDPAVYERRARLVVPALRAMGYEVVEPGGAFYCFPRTPIPDDVAFALALAEQERVLVVPGTGFGAPGHFRISLCVATERLERALPALARALQRHAPKPAPAEGR
ncbi:MAG: aspartate aminotransferase [Planctomycetota bacterium]|nr:MAG: aspartate aminotransferase [Planctomycetota bacterium]